MDKTFLRKKYNILQNKKDNFYILVFKDEKFQLSYKNIKVLHRVPPTILAELYNCADSYVGRSRVENLWLTLIEAMLCNVPIDVTSIGIFADWFP